MIRIFRIGVSAQLAMKEKSDDDKIKHYEEKIMKIKGRKGEDKSIEEELDNTNINEEEPEEPEGTRSYSSKVKVKTKSQEKASCNNGTVRIRVRR